MDAPAKRIKSHLHSVDFSGLGTQVVRQARPV